MESILIVDDHPVVRRGIRGILEEIPGVSVVGEANNASEALELIKSLHPSLVSLDITLPDKNGIELLKDIRDVHEHTRVIVLSMHPEEQYARQAFRNGAWGYITKDNLADELTRAVVRVIDGHKYVSSHFAETLLDTIDQPNHDSRLKDLSDREYQVLLGLAQGQTLKEIAGEYHISVQTVSTYRSRVLEKLDLENNAELVRYALTHKLIE